MQHEFLLPVKEPARLCPFRRGVPRLAGGRWLIDIAKSNSTTPSANRRTLLLWKKKEGKLRASYFILYSKLV
jgi:hypothetical protein